MNLRDKDDLFEKLAAIEHERWADWQRYLHSKLEDTDCGDYKLMNIADFNHWERQINTPYEQLSEKEKQSDREQIERYWHLIEATL